MTMRIALAGPAYQALESQPRFFEELLGRVAALPGVVSAGAVSNLPLNGGGTNTLRAEGEPEPDLASRPEAVRRGVGGSYFETLGIPLIEGRVFRPGEGGNGPPSLVLSESLARRLVSSGSAIGRRIRFYAFPDSAWEVIGVVGDVKTGSLDAPAPLTVYASHLRIPENRMSVAVRTAGTPELLAQAMRQEVAALDRELPVYALSTMESQISDSPAVFFRRFPLVLLSAFAVGALTLAVVGVYGIISYSLTQRTREFGVRLALGAAPGSLVRLLVKRGLMLGLLGASIGAAAAVAVARLLRTMLYGVTPTDPLTFLGTSALLLLVAAGASGLSAWRAARIRPSEALRAE